MQTLADITAYVERGLLCLHQWSLSKYIGHLLATPSGYTRPTTWGNAY